MIVTPLPKEFLEALPIVCPETQVLVNGLIEAKPLQQDSPEALN